VRLYNTGTLDVLDDGWKPDNATLVEGYDFAVFFQDTATFGNRLTITAGVRYDFGTNWNAAQNRLDSHWADETTGLNCPECFRGLSFPRQPDAITWSDLVPRVGVIYDIKGDGTWAVKFNYSRYAETIGLTGPAALNLNFPGREDWNWLDPNGDGVFQFGEQTTFRDAFMPGITIGQDPDSKSPLWNELTAGIEHELADNMLLSFTTIHRAMGNDIGAVDIGRPFGPMLDTDACRQKCTPVLDWGVDPWYPVETVDPGNDGTIGTADDGGPVTVWAVNPETYGSSFIVYAKYRDYGLPGDNEYTGFTLAFQKRWAGNWQMLASYDYGRAYRASGGATPNEVYNGRHFERGSTRPHMLKLTGNYLFAEPIGVNLGVFLRAMSGLPIRADYYYDDSVIEPPNGPWERQGNTWIILTPLGAGDVELDRPERTDFVTIVDVRAEKQVTVGRYGVLHFYVDVFNLFNANTVRDTYWTIGRNYGEIIDILPPRVLRLGGAWDF